MIDLQNISKQYSGRPVLRNLSLHVPEGQIFGMLGNNGAGKSTTINILLGFLKPDSGQVRVGGFDPVSSASEARRLIAYIPENVALYPELSGAENLEYLTSLGGRRLSPGETSTLLQRVGLTGGDASRRVSDFSKGMRQRVALALALARKARILLLDEPTSGLDPAAVRQLAVILRELCSEGASVLLTSHDLWHLSLDTDQVGILRDGCLHAQFRASEMSAQQIADAYLGLSSALENI
jgi:ABC-2 type transport system ATP-binding protein